MTTKSIKGVFAALLLAGAAAITGCSKITDLKPKDNTYDEVFWSNGANVEKAVAGAYGLFRSSLRNERSYFIFGDVPTGDLRLGSDYWNFETFVPDRGQRFSYAPYLENALWDWSRFYGVANQCHLIVEKAPGIPDSKFPAAGKSKSQLIGEALFLRAYNFFYMTRVWGDIILTKESLKDPLNVPQLGRTPESEVLDYCINDLRQAATRLELGTPSVYASKGAAWALLAHIYAWKKDYPNALKYCDSVINSGQYTLEPVNNYLNIWKGNSAESIFELNMKYNAQNNEATASFFNVFLYDPYITNRYPGSSWHLSDDALNNLFNDPADIRAQKIMGNTGNPDVSLLKYGTVNYYDPNSPAVYVIDNNLVMMRLADIILLKAEASYKTGNAGAALAALNQVKNRAGLASVVLAGNDLWDEILVERRRELIGEGHNYFDIIRTEHLLDYYPFYTQARIDKKGYYWPLYMRQLLPQAPLLTQNEWWKNN